MADFTADELEAARQLVEEARQRLRDRTKGKSIHDVADEYLLDALVELRVSLDSPNVKLRFAAADKIASVCTRMPPRPALPPEAGLSPEEYRQRLEAAARDTAVQKFCLSDVEFQAAAIREGWTPPGAKQAKERN